MHDSCLWLCACVNVFVRAHARMVYAAFISVSLLHPYLYQVLYVQQ